ncbi:PREDICTED: uncharacterized protein LOC104784239 [Camelina sativa]|uniref:Uncharacterized protein LOC104784239 n=1 Tax=Camelina sativa TaxID=90675 RepID=A0ABM0YXT2_CAMSA|nr:PREDICTED: uncharacterized protein LOC104784239 [Camelina sativa]
MGDNSGYGHDLPDWRTTLETVYVKYADEDDYEDVSGTKRYYPHIRRPKDEEPKISPEEECLLMEKQVEESKGFDIDFAKFCCRFNYLPVDFDAHNAFVLEPETTRELLDRLSLKSLERFNEINSTKYEFVKVIKANYHLSAGMMFYITFQAKLFSDDDSKEFQAKVCHLNDNPDFISCELKPEKRAPEKEDPKKPRLTHEPFSV